MYEVYLKTIPGLTNFPRLDQYGDQGVMLPAPPIGVLTRTVTPQVRVTETANNGSFSWPSGPALGEVSFSSLFPEPHMSAGPSGLIMPSYAHQLNGRHQYQDPGQWASLMMTMATEGIIFQLFIVTNQGGGAISNSGVFENYSAVIRSYTDWEDEGDARYYNVTFQEFRQLTVRKVRKVVKAAGTNRAPARRGSGPARPGSRPTIRTAPVRRLDTDTAAKPPAARRA